MFYITLGSTSRVCENMNSVGMPVSKVMAALPKLKFQPSYLLAHCLYLPRKRNLGKLYWRYYRSQFFPLPTMCHTVCKLYIITKAHFLYVKCIVVQESFMLCLEIQNWNAITPSCGPHSYVLVKSDQFYKKWSDLIINQRKYMKAFLHFCIEFWSTNSSGSDCFENWHRDIKII